MYFPLCAGPFVDVLCSQEQHKIKDNNHCGLKWGSLWPSSGGRVEQAKMLFSIRCILCRAPCGGVMFTRTAQD